MHSVFLLAEVPSQFSCLFANMDMSLYFAWCQEAAVSACKVLLPFVEQTDEVDTANKPWLGTTNMLTCAPQLSSQCFSLREKQREPLVHLPQGLSLSHLCTSLV